MFAMPNPDSLPPRQTLAPRGRYPTDRNRATPSLVENLRSQIAANGPLCFTDFMAAALYDPANGYYARQTRQVGRDGDFFTSVSTGPLFGELLARRFLREWHHLGSPNRWRILEIGAHDGTLAADILGAIDRLDPAAAAALEYGICEPLPVLEAAQRVTLTNRPVQWVAKPTELEPLPGVAFGNELLDALPFHVIEFSDGGWRECRVTNAPDDGFAWETHEIEDPVLVGFTSELGNIFPPGYRTEVRTNFADFLAPLTGCLTSGLLLWPDYGFAQPELYDPARTTGTLRTFANHRAGEDPLAAPGTCDITAHVDFTAVATAAIELGCVPIDFRSQGSWLTAIGRDWLLAQEGRPDTAAMRQFQTLTHPAHLGGQFHVLELAWNQPAAAISANVVQRLALEACPPAITR